MFLFLCAVAGCGVSSTPEFSASLESSEKEVEAGKSIKISVIPMNPPEGLHYRWSASLGQCSPQDVETTTFTAPANPGKGNLKVRVSVDISQGDQILFTKDVYVTVKEGAQVRGIDSSFPASSGTPVTMGSPNVTGATSPAAASPPSVVRSVVTFPTPESSDSQPVIRITTVPPDVIGGPNEMYDIAGVVSGVDPRKFRIVLYAYTNVPGQWWIQPFDYDWVTRINSDGTWSTRVHGGNRYGALLVSDSFEKPPFTTYSLPSISGAVVAISIVQGKDQ